MRWLSLVSDVCSRRLIGYNDQVVKAPFGLEGKPQTDLFFTLQEVLWISGCKRSFILSISGAGLFWGFTATRVQGLIVTITKDECVTSS